MKKFVKLTLAAAALATAFVFASCSDSDDDSNTTTQTANGNGSGTTGTQGNGTVDTGNTGNSASSSSTSGTGNSGTENSGNSSGNSSSTGNTGSTAAEASGTVVEKSFTDLEGKIFKVDGMDEYYKFEGGKVYKSTSIENPSWDDKTEKWNNKGISVVLFNGTQYASVEGGASSRTNGSGLYATFGEDDFPVAFRNDGTCTMPDENGGTISLNFTNENGLITLTMSGEKLYILYNGTSIYFVSDLLTEVTK